MKRLLLLLMAVLLVAPGALRASAVVPLTIEELNAVASDVVHGVVEYSETDFYNGKIFTLHTVRVEESFKGGRKSGADVPVVTLGGRMGRIGSVSPGMPTLEEGEEVILFLSRPAESERVRRGGPEGQEYNMESPFIANHQIIGGFQGKFKVVRHQVVHEAHGQRFFIESPRVHRASPGVAASIERAPSLPMFSNQLRSLNQGERARNTRSRDIPMIGRHEVVERDHAATALRHFDPMNRRTPPDPPAQQHAQDDGDDDAGDDSAGTAAQQRPPSAGGPALSIFGMGHSASPPDRTRDAGPQALRSQPQGSD